MTEPIHKIPPPPYSEVAHQPGTAPAYGFQVPNEPVPAAFPPTTQQPQPGYYPQQPNAYGTTTLINMQPQTQVILVNGCPNCRAGVLEDEYSCLGICCAIVFFPMGLLCCLLMRERRCTNCRALF